MDEIFKKLLEALNLDAGVSRSYTLLCHPTESETVEFVNFELCPEGGVRVNPEWVPNDTTLARLSESRAIYCMRPALALIVSESLGDIERYRMAENEVEKKIKSSIETLLNESILGRRLDIQHLSIPEPVCCSSELFQYKSPHSYAAVKDRNKFFNRRGR